MGEDYDTLARLDLDFVRRLFDLAKKSVSLVEEKYNLNNKIIYHYTTGENLLNIIETNKIWATHISCLNDHSEVKFAQNLFKCELLKYFSENINNQYSEHLNCFNIFEHDSSLNDFTPIINSQIENIFVTCFSLNKNDLSQWQSYGGGENGFAIGFASKKIKSNFLLGKISYNLEGSKIIKKMIEYLYKEIFPNKEFNDKEKNLEFKFSLISSFYILSVFIKDSAFKAENEVRILKLLENESINDLKFLQKKSAITTHLPLILGEGSNDKLPIKRIMVGPSRHQDISVASLERLLKQKGYKGVEVTKSNIPYRSL